MQKLAILLTTDHDDTDEAVKSVVANLKRAGYEYLDWHNMDNETGFFVEDACVALIKVCEPDVAEELETSSRNPRDNYAPRLDPSEHGI